MAETTAYREGFSGWKVAADKVKTTDQAEALEAQLSIGMLVREITAGGSVRMNALEDWKKPTRFPGQSATSWSSLGAMQGSNTARSDPGAG